MRRTSAPRIAVVFAALVPLTACKVGLDAHPLTAAQTAAIAPRPAPTQPDEIEQLTSIVVKVPIDASPDDVWQTLAVGYGDVHKWSGPIEASSFKKGHVEGGDGCVRSCTLGQSSPIGKGKSFSETIIVWDPASRFFAAGVNDGFFPLRRVVQEFWVDEGEAPERSVVTTQFHYDLSPPMGKGKPLKKRLKPQLVTSLLGLKHLIETGNANEAQDADYLASTYPSVFDANGV